MLPPWSSRASVPCRQWPVRHQSRLLRFHGARPPDPLQDLGLAGPADAP